MTNGYGRWTRTDDAERSALKKLEASFDAALPAAPREQPIGWARDLRVAGVGAMNATVTFLPFQRQFVNQFPLGVGHGFSQAVSFASGRAARALRQLMIQNKATRDHGGEFSCAFS